MLAEAGLSTFWQTFLALVAVGFVSGVSKLVWDSVRGNRGKAKQAERSDHKLLMQIADVVVGTEKSWSRPKVPGIRERLDNQDEAIAHLHECIEKRTDDFEDRIDTLESRAHSHAKAEP